MTTPSISTTQPPSNDANNNSQSKGPPRRQKSDAQEEEERVLPRFVFDPDSALVCYWTAAVAVVTLYNAWTIALRIAFPEMRIMNNQSYLPIIDVLCDLIYFMDIVMQLRTAYLQDGIPVFDPQKIRQNYLSQTYFIQDVICVLPSYTLISWLPDGMEFYKYFLCSAGAARLTKLLKFHILYKFYDLAESFTSNPHLIRVLRLFLNLTIIIHWIACLYYLLSEYEGLGSNDWVYTNATDQQRFSRKYLKCLYWSAMTLTTIGDTNTPETDLEYIFTGVIFLTGVFVFATVMGNVGDVISSMNANRQEFQARMDHIQMYLTHKKVPASLQLKIKKWAEYTWSRTKATDESRLLNMLPERLRAEVAVHVHLDSLKKVKIFEQCETGFLCELVLKLRSQVFSPGDYVCRVGETGREMFIINHGKVEVIVNNPATAKPMVVAVLSQGDYFGEISLLRLDGVQNRRTADVRSIGYSELLCLSRRDLMAALVEYPEAKSVLEDQAKKRMKTNLQAQRAFSVDTLLRSSQEQSSMDSGIVKDEVIGHDVSEIKAMIEELKNANKVPGRSVWQMIAKCEVLQAKLTEKEKEVEDSKNRIKDLENLLYSRHYPKHEEDIDTELLEEEDDEPQVPPIRNNNVTRQYSQDEGRQAFQYLPRADPKAYDVINSRQQVPDVKVTPSSETCSSEDESAGKNNFIKTSKITNIFERPSRHKTYQKQTDFEDVWNYTNETSIDHEITYDDQVISMNHEITYDDQVISMTTRLRDEFHLGDSLDLNVHTILEESEEELSGHQPEDGGHLCGSSDIKDGGYLRGTSNVKSEHSCYDGTLEHPRHDQAGYSLLVDARPLSFRSKASKSSPRELDNVLDSSYKAGSKDSGLGSAGSTRTRQDSASKATSSSTKNSGSGSLWSRLASKYCSDGEEDFLSLTAFKTEVSKPIQLNNGSVTNGIEEDLDELATLGDNMKYKDSGIRSTWKRSAPTNDQTFDDVPRDSGLKSMWKRSASTNGADKSIVRLDRIDYAPTNTKPGSTTPGDNTKTKPSRTDVNLTYKSSPSSYGSTFHDENTMTKDTFCKTDRRPTTTDEDTTYNHQPEADTSTRHQPDVNHTSNRNINQKIDRINFVPSTPDEDTSSKHQPEPDVEHQVIPEETSTQEIKRLLDGQASKSFKCVSGMDFLRMTSMRSLQSDNRSSVGSRRSSCVFDSDVDSEEDYSSS